MDTKAKAGVDRASIEVTVTRADGTVEEYGIVSRYEKNPVRHLYFRVHDRLRVKLLAHKYAKERSDGNIRC